MLKHQNELSVGAPRAKEAFRKTIEVITGIAAFRAAVAGDHRGCILTFQERLPTTVSTP